MSARFLLLALLFAAVGCSDDPAPAAEATVSADNDPEVRRLEAEARIAEARAREAEALAGAEDADEAPDEPEAEGAPATPAATPSSPTASSTRPGTTGLPAASNAPDLIEDEESFTFCETTRRSAVDRYVGMEVCYEGTVRQEGGTLVGSGRKMSENGTQLTGAARRPFRLEGRIYDDYTVRFNYTVEGTRRVARGSADLGGDTMNGACEGTRWEPGTFQTDAANSSGSSTLFISNDCGV